MIHTRRLQMVGKHSERKGLSMKVAFASQDKVHVNEHFGRATEFVIWEVGVDHADFVGMLQVSSAAGDEEDRIEARGAALADCAIVYVAQIGGPAAAKLVSRRIHPMKSKEQEPIEALIKKLQEVLQGNPPPWLRKAMLKSERPGFA